MDLTWLAAIIPVVIVLLGFFAWLLRRSNNPFANELAELFLQLQEILRSQNLTSEEKLRDIERTELRYAKTIARVEGKGPSKASMARRAEVRADKTLDKLADIEATLKDNPRPPQQK